MQEEIYKWWFTQSVDDWYEELSSTGLSKLNVLPLMLRPVPMHIQLNCSKFSFSKPSSQNDKVKILSYSPFLADISLLEQLTSWRNNCRENRIGVYWIYCIALRPRLVYIGVHDLEGKPLLRYGRVWIQNPNLPITEISQIYSNRNHTLILG